VSAPKAFPWDEAMAFAFCVLRLSPAQFWALTPRELALAMQPFLKANSAPDRSEFERLLSAFPDKET
jgi:uncharacterized phage protein (TIGR02216 family)